jgi:NADPH:quinone reductase-like Zn-dependent oxidoreductase
MKAIQVKEHGGYDVLRVDTVDDPRPAEDEVLVEVRAVSVNHLDLWVRRGVPGYEFPLPLVPGADVAGVVRAAGPRAAGVSEGDGVLIAPGVSCGVCRACLSGRDHHCPDYGILGEQRDGGYAELICVPRANVLPKPPNLSFEEAASVPLVFLTAWHMLTDRARLRSGETILVHAAGSGVSSAAVQIAKLIGATVIVTSGNDEKLETARELGADHGINYRTQDFVREVKRLTDQRGADVVLDHVGDVTWEGSLRCLAWQGRLVTCGATTGALVKLNLRHVFFKSLSVLGSTMGSKGELFDIYRLFEAGRLRAVVDRVLPLSEAGEAHRLLEERKVFGKIVLTPGA